MITLYELTENYKQLLELAEKAESEEEIELLMDTIDCNKDAAEVKLEGYGVILSELSNKSYYIDSEIKRLQQMKHAINNNIKRLKVACLEYLQTVDNGKVRTKHFNWYLQKNPPSVYVFDEKAIPDKYKSIVTSVKYNKNDIMNDLKAGIQIEGVGIKDEEYSVRYK